MLATYVCESVGIINDTAQNLTICLAGKRTLHEENTKITLAQGLKSTLRHSTSLTIGQCLVRMKDQEVEPKDGTGNAAR